MEEKLPQVVEDRLLEAYEKIREGKAAQRNPKKTKKNFRCQKWTGVAAACAVLAVCSIGAIAATSYFQKEMQQESGKTAYEFSLNYELIPGEYEVTPSYLPEGFKDQGDGKYDGGDGLGITIMPIYTTAELDKLDSELSLSGKIDEVKHTILSGMEADVITYQDAEKYQTPTEIYLFNPAEGCVIHLYACHTVKSDELLKFADSLTVKRVSDGAFETAEEKEAREQEETRQRQLNKDSQSTMEQLLQSGIPEEKLLKVGDELKSADGKEGYTVLRYEFLDRIDGFEQENFFDYSRFDGWLLEDGSLKPYTRLHYDQSGEILAEEQTEQRFLRVDIKAHRYEGSTWEEVPLDFQLVYVDKKPDGGLTWSTEWYGSVPQENYFLQMDHSAVYLDQATNRAPDVRSSYFFHPMEVGEDLTYTLLFVVDKDRQDHFVLAPTGANTSFQQTESESAEQILNELEGYIQLQEP